MRNAGLALILTLSSATVSFAEPVQSLQQKWDYPIKSLSINEFTLGMSFQEAKLQSNLQHLGGSDFKAEKDGITYYLGMTPKGRVYMIQSSQPLGRFTVDKMFVSDLRAKLISKYGQPQSESDDLFQWVLTENVERPGGPTLPFTTMWMSATTLGAGTSSEVSLEMKMLDFRILWEDQRALNRDPRSDASKKIQF